MADLFDTAGVVQHHQHPPPGQHTAVGGGALVHVQGNVLTGHTQRAEEPGQRVPRRHRLVGVIAAQVDVQLAVGELGPRAMGPPQRQRSLTHPGGTGQRGDHYGRCARGRGSRPGGVSQQGIE